MITITVASIDFRRSAQCCSSSTPSDFQNFLSLSRSQHLFDSSRAEWVEKDDSYGRCSMAANERSAALAAERVDLTVGSPLFVPGRRPMYPLPIKGKYGRSSDLVLAGNESAARFNPGGGSVGAANGGLIMLSLMLLLIAGVLCQWVIFELMKGSGASLFIVLFSGGVAALLVWVIVALVRTAIQSPVTYPILISRKMGLLVQLQGKKRVEASWEKLRPYIEPVTSISSVGSSTSCNIHLIEAAEDGCSARCQILLQNALGIYDCLATYEFLARYMEGDWDGLPDIHLLPAERPAFWDAYRYGFFNPWIGVPHWRDRSSASRRLMGIFTPLWTIIFWPLVMLTILGSRMGSLPRFSDEKVAFAGLDSSGVVAELLGSKIKAPLSLAEDERFLYRLSVVSGGVLWCALTLAMLSFMFE